MQLHASIVGDRFSPEEHDPPDEGAHLFVPGAQVS